MNKIKVIIPFCVLAITLIALTAIISCKPEIQSKEYAVKGVSFKMIKVEGGSFMMGGPEPLMDERPVHEVTLSTYWIAETEVTQELWEVVRGDNPSKVKGKNKPLNYESWLACQDFIDKLNNITGMQFRLPTEAEWEFAARGGNYSHDYKYSGSNTIDLVAWYVNNCGNEKIHDVKGKQPNELGIFDMTGNVAEWCEDGAYSYNFDAQINPRHNDGGPTRMVRGGCYADDYNTSRIPYRHRGFVSEGDNSHPIGLRLALSHE